jgi:hypothetical protein
VLLGVLATYWMPVAAHAEGALAGIQTRHVLVATPERALDVARDGSASHLARSAANVTHLKINCLSSVW